MARQRKEKEPKIKLKQPDRSGPDPSQQTLFDLAEERGLLKPLPSDKNGEEEDDEEALVGRLGDAVLWSASLTMLHVTLDVLVTHQYAVQVVWRDILSRALQAFPVLLLLFYTFHPHSDPSMILPSPHKVLPPKLQAILHQLIFFVVSIAAGGYLIYITNESGHYAVMKRAPPLGCIWIWSVIELDLLWAVGSCLVCAGWWRWQAYDFL